MAFTFQQIGVDVVSDLTGLPGPTFFATTNVGFVFGGATRFDGLEGLYFFDATSTATPDGFLVLCPSIVTPPAPGRWLRSVHFDQVQADWNQTNSAAIDFINNKPDLTIIVPIGSMLMWSTNSAPSNWLFCDGSAVSRTTYANLFSVISTTYGSGDGSTTFNVPDLRQRFPLGKAVSGTGSTLAATGGMIDHIHTVDPGTTSTSSDGLHNHTGATGTPSTTVAATNLTGSAASTTHTHSISSDGAHTHTIDISSFNSGTANPPFLVINFIIKT